MTEILPSLSSFVERNSSSAEIYDTKRICVLVKHTIEPHIAVYGTLVNALRENPTDADTYGQLLEIAEQVRRISREILNTLKVSAELEVLQSTKFDSLQVLALVQQLPVLILDEVTALIYSVISELPTLEDKSELAIQIYVQGQVDSFASSLREKIDNLSVPVTTSPEATTDAGSIQAVEEEVIAMRLSVPTEKQEKQA